MTRLRPEDQQTLDAYSSDVELTRATIAREKAAKAALDGVIIYQGIGIIAGIVWGIAAIVRAVA